MTMKTALTLILITCLFAWSCDTKTKNVDSCGDGFVDPGEQCDTTLGENSCQSLGYYNALGTLTCTSDCQFDDSLCGGRCGDSLVQEGDDETCDGGNLNGQTCQSLGYTGGTLACGAGCTYDVSGCAGRCGNGVIDEDEVCDGGNLAEETCLTQGYHGGALACEADCNGYNLDNCVAVGQCGDGVIQETYGEVCDGGNLDGHTCQGEGFYSGLLACSADCNQLDLTDCEAVGRCGDGVIQGTWEDCEGLLLDGQDCGMLGHYPGALACGDDCAFNFSGCGGSCGDGVIQAASGEVCDGGNLDGHTCQGEGFYGGLLACGADCQQLDLTDCEAVGSCGDGVIQAAYEEVCDSSALGTATCVSLGYSPRGGVLACTTGCLFDGGLCVPKSTNANLATLTVSSGTLTPAFDPATLGYVVVVPNAVSSLTVAATAADAPWATVAVSPGQPMALVVGANVATVTVTAEDGGAPREYTVRITRASPGDVISPNIGILKQVPAGTFQRDSEPTDLSTVSAFRMSQNEITRAQWTAVTGWADPSDAPHSSGMSDPVQGVSWYDAIAFCNKLSALEGLTPVYTVSGVDFTTLTYAAIPTSTNATWDAATANWAANGYRLPTETERMWAAMGADSANPGVTNTTGYAKAFAGSTGSNSIGDYAWYDSNSSSRTHPAGTKLPNELGFHDLTGNVLELNWDWYADPYPPGTLTDYRGPASGSYRVMQGGSWYNDAVHCTLAAGYLLNPYDRGYFLGFRVVRP